MIFSKLPEVIRFLLLVSAGVLANSAESKEVELAGIFAHKAVLMIDGGPPRTLAVGERTSEGVRLLEVSRSGGTAVIEVNGQRRRLEMGQTAVQVGGSSQSRASAIMLLADSRGHYLANGNINGAAVRFLVDTGASMVSMGISDARRAGIDARSGTPAVAQTAAGPTTVWLHRLDTVRVGEITVHGVDALVHENDLPFVLLGMSFLNRMDLQREGDRLVLRRRY